MPTSEPVDDGSRLLLTMQDAADRLSISRAHLYRQLEAGKLQSVWIGRSRRISTAALHDFVASLGDDSAALNSGAVTDRRTDRG